MGSTGLRVAALRAVGRSVADGTAVSGVAQLLINPPQLVVASQVVGRETKAGQDHDGSLRARLYPPANGVKDHAGDSMQ